MTFCKSLNWLIIGKCFLTQILTKTGPRSSILKKKQSTSSSNHKSQQYTGSKNVLRKGCKMNHGCIKPGFATDNYSTDRQINFYLNCILCLLDTVSDLLFVSHLACQ